MLGSPSQDDLNSIINDKARSYIQTLPASRRVPWAEQFPNANTQGECLVSADFGFLELLTHFCRLDSVESDFLAERLLKSRDGRCFFVGSMPYGFDWHRPMRYSVACIETPNALSHASLSLLFKSLEGSLEVVQRSS